MNFMAKKDDSTKFYMTVSVIVAIVAVVGLVMMFTGRGSSSTFVMAEDTAGQAFRATLDSDAKADSVLAKQDLDTDVVSKAGLQNGVFDNCMGGFIDRVAISCVNGVESGHVVCWQTDGPVQVLFRYERNCYGECSSSTSC